MHNHNDKYLARLRFEPGPFRLQAPVDANEPSGLTDGSRDYALFLSNDFEGSL